MEQHQVSIHFRRRRYYALWSLLLVLSIAAKVLWEIPVRTGTADLDLRCQITGLPEGSRLQAWSGPKNQWSNIPWDKAGTLAQVEAGPGSVKLPLMTLPVGFRRWVHDYIPRKTADLVVLRILPKSGLPRYSVFPLGSDWHSGLLQPGKRMLMTINCPWAGLDTNLGVAIQRI